MNLNLETITVWHSEKAPNPHDFFKALEDVLSISDIIVIGSYEWPNITSDWLSTRRSVDTNMSHIKPYTTSFELNREQYPHGREYIMQYNQDNIDELASECGVFKNCDIFLDHLIAK